MAYTKNLGRVKGEKGDLYYPNLSYQDGQFIFAWRRENDTFIDNTPKQLTAPVLIPTYDSETGNLKFVPNVPIRDNNGNLISTNVADTPYNWHIKGDKGDNAVAEFDINHTNKTLEELIIDLRTQRGTISSEELKQIYNSSTLYIVKPDSNSTSSADIYVYDDADDINDSDRFIKIEGMDLSDYYRKNQLYNREEIDDMFDTQQQYLQAILRLLDVEDNQYELNGVTLDDSTLNTLLDEKLTGYVKLADIEYVDIDGVLYFVKRD